MKLNSLYFGCMDSQHHPTNQYFYYDDGGDDDAENFLLEPAVEVTTFMSQP